MATEGASFPLALEVPNLPGVRCQACGGTARNHVSAYRRNGRLYLLCWMCAAQFSAALDGCDLKGATDAT